MGDTSMPLQWNCPFVKSLMQGSCEIYTLRVWDGLFFILHRSAKNAIHLGVYYVIILSIIPPWWIKSSTWGGISLNLYFQPIFTFLIGWFQSRGFAKWHWTPQVVFISLKLLLVRHHPDLPQWYKVTKHILLMYIFMNAEIVI